MRRYLPFLIISAVLLIGSAAAFLLYRSKSPSAPLLLAAGKPGAEPAYVRGSPTARVTLEEFGDFQCPPCSFLAATLLKVEHDYSDSVRVVFRQFPLSGHAHAMTAACAAEAAGLQGRFWEMHDMLFQNSPTWSKEPPKPFIRVVPQPGAAPNPAAEGVRAVFSDYAAKLGLDVGRFNRDMETEQVKARIRTDQERGESVGIKSTPTLFLNGTQLPFQSLDEKELRKVIDAALSGATPTPPPPVQTPIPPNPAQVLPSPAPAPVPPG